MVDSFRYIIKNDKLFYANLHKCSIRIYNFFVIYETVDKIVHRKIVH